MEYIEAIRYTRTTFVYIKSDGHAYRIPYGPRPDLTGQENGKLYPAAEAMEVLDRAYPAQNAVISAGESVVWGGARQQAQESPWMPYLLWAAAGPAVIAVFCVAVILRKRGKSNGLAAYKENNAKADMA